MTATGMKLSGESLMVLLEVLETRKSSTVPPVGHRQHHRQWYCPSDAHRRQ